MSDNPVDRFGVPHWQHGATDQTLLDTVLRLRHQGATLQAAATLEPCPWERFQRWLQPLLLGYFRWRGCDHWESEELTAAALLKVVQAFSKQPHQKGSYDPERASGGFRGWLRRLAQRVWKDWLRHRRRHPDLIGKGEFGEETSVLDFFADQKGHNPSDEVADREELAFILAAAEARLVELYGSEQAHKQMTVWRMHYIEQCAAKDIAGAYQVVEGTVYRWLLAVNSAIQAEVKRRQADASADP